MDAGGYPKGKHPAAAWSRSVRAALAEPGEWACFVRTQLRFLSEDGARRPDLEIRFDGRRSDGTPTQVWLWIGSSTEPRPTPSSSVLISRSSAGGACPTLLLLAPRGQIAGFPREQVLEEIPVASWQSTAGQIRKAPL